MAYIIWGREVGENGTPHLQGYCELNKQQSRKQITKIPGFAKAWTQRRHQKSSQKQAIDYCKKDGDWEEHGEPKVRNAPLCAFCRKYNSNE